MTFNYTKSAATALRLLTKFGQAVTVRKITPGTYNPETGSTVDTTANYVTKGALFDFNERQLGNNFAGGSTIEIGDKYALVAPQGVTVSPDPNDKLVIGAMVWNIQNIKALAPAGIVVLYEFHLRK